VKGRTENALLALPFKAAYMFRPAAIIPMHGITSRTGWYRAIYAVIKPLMPALKRLFPKHVTTTEHVGRAMLRVTREGFSSRVVENDDIERVGSMP